MVRSELAEMGWWDSTLWEMLRMFSERLTFRGRLTIILGRSTRKV